MPHNRVFLRLSTRSRDDVGLAVFRESTFNLMGISEVIDDKDVLRFRTNNGRSYIVAPESDKVFRDAIEGMMVGVRLDDLFVADPVQGMVGELQETVYTNHKALMDSIERKRNEKKEG